MDRKAFVPLRCRERSTMKSEKSVAGRAGTSGASSYRSCQRRDWEVRPFRGKRSGRVGLRTLGARRRERSRGDGRGLRSVFRTVDPRRGNAGRFAGETIRL